MATAVTPRATWEDVGKLILRLTVAVLLMVHGISKLKNGIGWMAGMLESKHLPAFIGYGVYVGEIVAPILLILGMFTRLAGLVVSFNLLMAIVLARAADVWTLNRGGGWAIEIEMFFLLAGVAIFFLGSGRYALRKGLGRWD